MCQNVGAREAQPGTGPVRGSSLHSSGRVNLTNPLPIGGLSYVQGHTSQLLVNSTVGECLDATAQRFPNREALVIVHENIRLNFAQLKEEVSTDLEPSESGCWSLAVRAAEWARAREGSVLGAPECPTVGTRRQRRK